MQNTNVGGIIKSIRIKEGISQKFLCYGFCTPKSLSRIEEGERKADKFLFDALFQRLGKSSDKIEMVLSQVDYDLLKRREAIELALKMENYLLVELLLQKYQSIVSEHSVLHKQYIYKITAIIESVFKQNKQKTFNAIMAALKLTIPNYKNINIQNYCLTLEESHLILMLAVQYINTKHVLAVSIINSLVERLEQQFTDEEEKVKIYPNAVCIAAFYLIEDGEFQKAKQLCEKAIALLNRNGAISCLSELLKLSIKALKCMGNEQSVKLLKKQYVCIKEIYYEYEFVDTQGKANILQTTRQNDLLLVNEIIKKNREAKQISQEQLSEDICSPETLSRIETGDRAPNANNFNKLLNKLEIKKQYYNTLFLIDDFDIYESKRELSKLLFLNQYEKAESLFEKLKTILGSEDSRNCQFLLYNQVLFDLYHNKISNEEAIEKYKLAIHMTQIDFDKVLLNQLILSREDIVILNRMAVTFRTMGKKLESIQLLYDILQSLSNSKISFAHHSKGALMTMANLSNFLEEQNRDEEAIKICDSGIKLALYCGRGNCLSSFLSTKACCLEKMDTNRDICAAYFQKAYIISAMEQDIVIMNIIKNYFESNYKEYEL